MRRSEKERTAGRTKAAVEPQAPQVLL